MVVTPSDPAAVAEAIVTFREPRCYAAARLALGSIAPFYTWDRVAQPLVEFCRRPALAPDRTRSAPALEAGREGPGDPGRAGPGPVEPDLPSAGDRPAYDGYRTPTPRADVTAVTEIWTYRTPHRQPGPAGAQVPLQEERAGLGLVADQPAGDAGHLHRRVRGLPQGQPARWPATARRRASGSTCSAALIMWNFFNGTVTGCDRRAAGRRTAAQEGVLPARVPGHRQHDHRADPDGRRVGDHGASS